MIIEFSVTNFRSIRERQTLSMKASAVSSKAGNTFEVELASGEQVTLVKTAGIYGHNSFGKSNLIHALFNLNSLIRRSSDYKIDQKVDYYDPFLFHIDSKMQDTAFELFFIHKSKDGLQKFRYAISFNATEITSEVLDYYPEKKKRNIFKRNAPKGGLVHKAKLAKEFNYKEYEIYRNQLLLSKFGGDIPNEFLANVYLFFEEIDIWNISDSRRVSLLRNVIKEELKKTENAAFFEKLNRLIKIADVKIEQLVIRDLKNEPLPDDLPDEVKKIIEKSREIVFAQHPVFDNNKEVAYFHDLPFGEESMGTNYLFSLGGLILQKLEHGGIIVFDEIDTSLHPILSRFLVQLCNNPIANPGKAQLIFTSHELNILDRNSMRSDQIWFTDKNEYGETDVYSLHSIDGIREDIPFDKWYMAGKFGAIPHINDSDISSVFEQNLPLES